jgi:hypothetical protein
MAERTVVTYTCDLCESDCLASDREIAIKISNGDGRDVGPGFIRGTMGVFLPYEVSNGHLCKQCMRDWLTKWLAGNG